MGRDGWDWICCMPAAVSIHAPAWGATQIDSSSSWIDTRFNPRARMGRDLTGVGGIANPKTGFNPRARMGRDL